MSTSLKAELENWAAALNAYDEQDFDKALDLFSHIADSSKILTNMGLIYATIGEHEAAVQQFISATTLDPYLAIAYFQCGVSNFLLSRYEPALQNFEDALLYLRGNQTINYEQIGLKFQLFTPEVLFNKGLSQIYLGYLNEGLAEMEEARKLKVTDEHDVIDDAIRDGGEGYTVFSIPVGVLYRPAENKLKNSKSKDYLGKAKLVAAADETDAFTEFTGVKKLKEEREKVKERDQENDDGGLKRSATVPPPRIDPIDPLRQPTLERSKTTAAPVERMNTLSRPNPPFTSRRTRSDTADIPGFSSSLPSNLSRSNSVAMSRSNTIVRTKTPLPSAAVSRGPTMRKNEVMPSQDVNKPGTLLQPPFSLQNPYPEPLQIPNPYQQLYQSQPPARNQYQQSQPSPRNMYPTPPASLQASSPPVQKPPFVLPATRSLPQEPPIARPTDFSYDDYLNAYAGVEPGRSVAGSSPIPGQDRVVLWPQAGAQSSPEALSSSFGAGLSISSRGPLTGPHSQGPSSADAPRGADMVRNAGGTSMRRKPTRRQTQRRPRPAYEEEEEEYMSGEYDDLYELVTIRVKLHYQEDVRGMTLTPDTPFEEFVERVTSKFGTALDGLGLKFKDEDDVKVTLRDSSDYELAIETARHTAKGKAEGKLEIWCTDMRT